MEQLNLQLFLRIMKKAHDSVLYIKTMEDELYSFQYMKDERVWKVSHGDMVDFKRNVNKLIRRIGIAKNVTIKTASDHDGEIGS